ncbi:MAG: DUF188 domain-containing protein [Spirochaetia bacterium]|jgi:uncharacterized protein YaiI (UPF0178 family)|nr:DUF188 domain-containing protein [Spirochaetia bacterium]
MKIWVDSDSCPRQIRQIIVRASIRVEIKTVFVANVNIPDAKNKWSSMQLVPVGEGEADKYIVRNGEKGDMAITRDIPLAADLVKMGLLVLDDRGSVFTADNIGERLSMRNAMTELRSYGVMSKSSGTMSNKDIQQFANAFDKELRTWQNNFEKKIDFGV